MQAEDLPGTATNTSYEVKRMAGKKKLRFDFNAAYCKSCGICYGLCPKQVLAADDEAKPTVVNADECILCRLCEFRCPDFAIRVEGVEV